MGGYEFDDVFDIIMYFLIGCIAIMGIVALFSDQILFFINGLGA